MRPLLAFLPLLVLAGGVAAQVPSATPHPATPRSAAERELFRLEDGWTTALVRRDTGYFRRTLAPGYVYSDETGVADREQTLREMTASSDTVTYAANEDMRAHVYGTTGVVTGILVTRGRGAGGAFQHRYRFTDTWIRRGGRWIMVASQDYDIPAASQPRDR